MKLLYVTSEALPFAKTGGLADVAGSLPKALARRKIAVRGIMPLYTCIDEQYRSRMTKIAEFSVNLSWRSVYVGLYELKQDGVKWYFLDNEYYFKREGLYGYMDDGERYAFFCLAVIESIRYMDIKPDVIHTNDWQGAMIPVYLKLKYGLVPELCDIKTVLTIHNIQYQGKAHRSFLDDVCGLSQEHYYSGLLSDPDGNDCINMLKGGILLADRVTTVSPTYAHEIQNAYFAHGLDRVLSAVKDRLSGIINGIDTDYYSAEKSPYLTCNFTAGHLEDKAKNKLALQKNLGLFEDAEVPVFAVISRLVNHKGLDLIAYMMDSFLERPVQLVVLGQGEPGYEAMFLEKMRTHHGQVAAQITFSNELAFQIYAGSDFLLMPSKSEPCGLSQMIAMQFGTVPIVRNTGGLCDTVDYFFDGVGNGFKFDNYNGGELLWTVEKALGVYYDKPSFATLRKNCMASDFTWTRSARDYSALYKSLLS